MINGRSKAPETRLSHITSLEVVNPKSIRLFIMYVGVSVFIAERYYLLNPLTLNVPQIEIAVALAVLQCPIPCSIPSI